MLSERMGTARLGAFTIATTLSMLILTSAFMRLA